MDNPMQIMNVSNCETSVIFSGGGPPDVGAFVQIGSEQLIPAPFVTLALEKYKLGDYTIGGVLKLNLNGTVVGDSFNDIADGLNKILTLGKSNDCVSVTIQCTNKLIYGTGRIISVSANEGNQPSWVNMAPYSIEIEVYTNNGEPVVNIDSIDGSNSLDNLMLKNISESFSYSINEDTFNWGGVCPAGMPASIDGFGNRHIKLNFSINVAGVRGCNSGVVDTFYYGLDAAERYLKNRLTAFNFTDLSSVKDPPNQEIISANNDYIGGSSYLDFRTISINPIENSIEVSGEMIFRPTGCLNKDVFTTLNVEQQLSTDGENIVISGNIIGLSNHQYSDIIKLNPDDWNTASFSEKINNANNFLTLINSPTILKKIAECYKSSKGYLEDDCEYSATYDDCVTQTTPAPAPEPELCDFRLINSSISRNISAGEINFTFTLSNTANCEVLGAKKVNVEITHDKPHDNIVEIVIPGRGSKGVLIQNLCCNSAEKVDLTVDATLNKKTCNFTVKKQTIDELRQCAIKALEDLMAENPDIDVSCWFKTNDQESIGNTTYKLSRSYVKPSCP